MSDATMNSIMLLMVFLILGLAAYVADRYSDKSEANYYKPPPPPPYDHLKYELNRAQKNRDRYTLRKGTSGRNRGESYGFSPDSGMCSL